MTSSVRQQGGHQNDKINSSANTEIDIIQLFINLYECRLIVISLFFLGVFFVILLTFRLPNVYRSEVSISLPPKAALHLLNGSELAEYSSKEVFSDFFNTLRSESVLYNYIKSQGFISDVYYDSSDEFDILFSRFMQGVRFEVIEPVVSSPQSIEYPTRVKISIASLNESVTVPLLNGYVKHVNRMQANQLQQELESSRQISILTIKQEIADLIGIERIKRNQRIEQLERKNRYAIEELKQNIKLLQFQSKSNRKADIDEAIEARKIATSLAITLPTTLEQLKHSNETKTQITLNSENKLPLFLMGTKYLSVYIEALQARSIDFDYAQKINKLQSEIQRLESNVELRELKERVDDSIYVEKMPLLKSRLKILEEYSFDFSNVELFTFDKKAMVTKLPFKPNKVLYIIIGIFLSLFVSILVGLSMLGIRRRLAVK